MTISPTSQKSARRSIWRDPRKLVDSVARSSPARLALVVFALVALTFTLLLSLPLSAADGQATPLHDSLFTAFSAVTVTGLVTVNTAEHWSFFGQVVILLGIQVGGLGIVTMASLLARAVTRQLGVRSKLLAQQGISTGKLGEVGSLLRTVVLTTLAVELALAVLLVPSFIVADKSWTAGLWHGIFYAVSSFNNAGFVSHPDGLNGFADNLWILVPIMVGVFIGSLGFPVFMVLMATKFEFRKWTVHTKLTLLVTTILLIAGAVIWAIFEWSNSSTIGDMDVGEKVFHAVFASTMMRSGGFSIVDPSASSPVTLLATDALMFAGGGSASTAGGIKVTTIAVLFLAILAEVRGDSDVRTFGRTITEGALRVAISVLFLAATLILVATGLLMAVSREPLDRILFEVISAFATCGLSVGLSEELPPFGKYVLSALMFAGRIGPISLAAALSIRQRRQLYRFPNESPIIG
ncbi:TrkH family potassium uptake protein [Mycetocola miduiensis]|uniref:Trk-type K+ transport system, membrane component n=1 Tax=Mycetocola miduiensis TaxID=995034 RepID=A0A1I4ZKD0_9MICO|nr:potassium transporter TrkG [Mycetocola miduiensis]SFN50410.1 Trk-type K+ transport system, membrane component [Mycetocola miduiensis]